MFALLLLAATACRTQPPQEEALALALRPFVDVYAEVVDDDIEWVAGESQAPEALDPAGIFLIDNEEKLTRIWASQGEGALPEVDFSREVVLAVFLTRSSASSLRFHSLRFNEEERIYEAYVLGEQKPLPQVRYNLPYCLVVLPVRAGTIRGHLIHVRELADGGWEIQPLKSPVTMERELWRTTR